MLGLLPQWGISGRKMFVENDVALLRIELAYLCIRVKVKEFLSESSL